MGIVETKNISPFALPERMANIAAASIIFILSVSFSASYFSYALVVWGIFVIYEYWASKKLGISFERKLSKEILVMGCGLLIFYGSLFIAGLIQLNIPGIGKAGRDLWLVAPFVMLWWLASKYDIKRGVSIGIIIGMGITCLIGLWQYHVNPGIRIEALYAHPNHFGTMVNLTIPILAYALIKSRQNMIRYASILVIALELICMYLTQSRGAMLAMAGGTFLAIAAALWLFRKKMNKKTFWYAQLLLVGILVFSAVGTQYVMTHRLEEHLGGERQFMITSSIEMWEDHKLIGVGMADWGKNYYGKYKPAEGKEKGLAMPHNMPLYFLSTTGIIGFVGYVIFLVSTIYAIYKSSMHKRDFYWTVAIGIIFISFFIQGLVDTTIINKIPARMFFALLGYGITMGLKEGKKNENFDEQTSIIV